MLLSDWYPLLAPYTSKTDLIDLTLPKEEQNRRIAEILAQGPRFVRLDELSPKHFRPCTTVEQVWQCLQVPRTLDVIRTSKYLCLREWVDFTDLIELRCFINGKITAISQNDAQASSEPLAEFCDPAQIKSALIRYVDQFLHLLPPCTLDLAVDRQLNFQVIEVNSTVHERAGSALFDMENPADLHLLDNGPVVLRFYADLFYNLDQV